MKDKAPKTENQAIPDSGLVNGPRLLEIVFPEKTSRPSLRSLSRYVRRRLIPCVKLGRHVYFSPEHVMEALLKKQSVRGGGR